MKRKNQKKVSRKKDKAADKKHSASSGLAGIDTQVGALSDESAAGVFNSVTGARHLDINALLKEKYSQKPDVE
jgi:hypothetical protein